MAFNLRHLLGTALHDIPLVSDAVQAAQGGKVQYGPDLAHAKPWMPPAGMNPAQHAQLRSILGTPEQRHDFAAMQQRPLQGAQTANGGIPLTGNIGGGANPQGLDTSRMGPYNAVNPVDTDQLQVTPQIQGGQRVYWQNTDQQRRNMVNPQINDNGFFY